MYFIPYVSTADAASEGGTSQCYIWIVWTLWGDTFQGTCVRHLETERPRGRFTRVLHRASRPHPGPGHGVYLGKDGISVSTMRARGTTSHHSPHYGGQAPQTPQASLRSKGSLRSTLLTRDYLTGVAGSRAQDPGGLKPAEAILRKWGENVSPDVPLELLRLGAGAGVCAGADAGLARLQVWLVTTSGRPPQ